jgi:hypothetical protein
MSCEQSQQQFFAHQAQRPELIQTFGSARLAQQALEEVFSVARGMAKQVLRKKQIKQSVEARTRSLFDQMQRDGIKPPTHSKNGLPKLEAQVGYAFVQLTLESIEKGEKLPLIAQQVRDAMQAAQPLTNPNHEQQRPKTDGSTFAQASRLLAQGEDQIRNDHLAKLYSRIASALRGEPRTVHFGEPGCGFATSMNGTIRADPLPLGAYAPVVENLVVIKAGIYHEIAHEQYTPPATWAKVLAIAQSPTPNHGLDQGRALLPTVYNIIEDGGIERLASAHYQGVAETLAASCALEPRWDERVGEHVPVPDQVLGALLYTALPYFAVSPTTRAAMSQPARTLFEELEPMVLHAVTGSPEDRFQASLHVAQRLEQECGAMQTPPRMKVSAPPPPSTHQQAAAEQEAAAIAGKPHATEEEEPQKGRRQQQVDDEPLHGRPRASQEEQARKGKRQQQVDDEALQGRPQPADPDGVPIAAPLDPPEQPELQHVPRFDETQLHAIIDTIEQEAARAVEQGVRRSLTPQQLGKPLHRPLLNDQSQTQRYQHADGRIDYADVSCPSMGAWLQSVAQQRAAANRTISAALTKQLRAIKEQTEQKRRLQSQGKLDRRRFVAAVRESDQLYTNKVASPETRFAVSLLLDKSSSMDEHYSSGAVFDATSILSQTFEDLSMRYEVRSFSSGNSMYKSMDEGQFQVERAAALLEDYGGSTAALTSTALARTSLRSCDEHNKLMIMLTDGDLDDHEATQQELQACHRNGIVTFGIRLGIVSQRTKEKLDELYGKGNWVSIQSMQEMPLAVGSRLASIFKRLQTR